jgi:hypothetical protein
MKKTHEGNMEHYFINLALNVSFLNKKRFRMLLDTIPPYSIVHINGADSVYIDNDILEIIQDYKSKAHQKHIELKLTSIPEADHWSALKLHF